MEQIAKVVSEQMSDGSKVFNVVVSGCQIDVVIGAISEGHAAQIADALNAGVAWIDSAESVAEGREWNDACAQQLRDEGRFLDNGCKWE